MSEVWIHWAGGLWMLTSDGINLVDKAPRVLLRDVRFVIDPVGVEIARNRKKRKTHAWAVGTRADLEELATTRVWLAVNYHPLQGDDNFHLMGASLSGADWLDAFLTVDQFGAANIVGPRYGETEHRRVQQYGGRR